MHEEFIGTGWSFPMGVNASGGIAMARREQELEQAMRLILMTYPGERPMRPAFGCRVRDFVFERATEETAALLGYEVRGALARWEPRVNVEKVDVIPHPEERNLLFIDIQYAVKATNDRRNLVFPFYTIPEEPESE
jgi:phage baseplate assembly protein W